MTRKDYERLANAFRKSYEEVRSEDSPNILDSLAGMDVVLFKVMDALRADNPRFDGQRFYDAVFFGDVAQ